MRRSRLYFAAAIFGFNMKPLLDDLITIGGAKRGASGSEG
jgi:hypothetical protein